MSAAPSWLPPSVPPGSGRLFGIPGTGINEPLGPTVSGAPGSLSPDLNPALPVIQEGVLAVVGVGLVLLGVWLAVRPQMEVEVEHGAA